MHKSISISAIILALLFLHISCDKSEDLSYLENRSLFFKNNVTPIQKDSIITVATYNIKLGFNLNDDPWNADLSGGGQEQLEALAGVLKGIDAEIIALQEVPRNRYNSKIKEYIEALADEMKMNYVFGSHGYNEPYITPAKGEWGCAILTKFEIFDVFNHEILYEDVWARRSMVETNLKVNKHHLINAFSLHWYPRNEEEENTANHIIKPPSIPIVMGDFNKTGPLELLQEKGLIDVDSTFTTHGVDRIFVRPSQYDVLEIGVVDTLVSDHFPSWAKLKIK